MTGYLVAGLALGSIYAIAASGITLTYASSGILNFAFGAVAFFVARFYYFLNTQNHWSILDAGVLALASGPLIGILLYWSLFRHLRLVPSVVKVVATVGLSVALPALAIMVFGDEQIYIAPGLAPQPVQSFQLAGVPVTADQLFVFGALILVGTIGVVVFRFTHVGLSIRAIVDSEAMTALSGTSPARVYMGVWAASMFFAGLAGILAAPLISLRPESYAFLTAAAFAAVVVAKLRSIPVSVVAGLAMGVVSLLIRYAMPPSSDLTVGLIDSVPFAFILVALAIFMRGGRLDEAAGVGGALDRAIAPQVGQRVPPDSRPLRHSSTGPEAARLGAGLSRLIANRVRLLQGAAVVAGLAVLPLVLGGEWSGMTGLAIAYAVVFLSMTLVTGEGGMVWLCQITFAGVGALTAAQLATNHGWPVLPALLAGGLIAVPMGVAIGLITLRLGDLYVAITTLTVGLLMDNLVFSRPLFTQFGSGVNLNFPGFIHTSRGFSYFALVVFSVVALLVVRFRRSTTGLALNAMRWSEPGARTIGLSVLQVKLLTAGLAAFVAALGGGLLALYSQIALPASYATPGGLVWLAVLVTFGIRSNIAAAFAGLAFAFMPALFQAFLPTRIGLLPSVLFGLGAVGLAMSPDGVVAQFAHALERAITRLFRRRQVSVREVPENPVNVVAASATLVSAEGAAPTASAVVEQPEDDGGVDATPSAGSVVVLARGNTAPDEAAVVSARNVTVRFGGLTALHDVTLEVPRGQIVGLVGPNGAGKSTLLGVISGFVRPNAGTVLLNGNEVTDLSPHVRSRRGVGRTFQHSELYSGLTVREHLVLAHRARFARRRIWTDLLAPARADAMEAQRVNLLLDTFGLADVADERAGILPLGVGKRLEIARALAIAPDVILLDEPSSGLDDRESARLARLLARVVEESGVSAVLIEHDMAVVLSVCDPIYVLDFGRLIAKGSPDEIRKDPAVRLAYLGDEVPEAEVRIQA